MVLSLDCGLKRSSILRVLRCGTSLYFPSYLNNPTPLYSKRPILLCSLLSCFLLLVRNCFFSLISYLTQNTATWVTMVTKCNSLTSKVVCCLWPDPFPWTDFDYFWYGTFHYYPKIIAKILSPYLYSLIIYGSHKQTQTQADTFFYYM